MLSRLHSLTLQQLTLIFLTCLSQTGFAETITVTSFNIEWYGSKGGPNVNAKKRDRKLRTFFKHYGYDKHEVLVFQEIVDTERLQKRVLEDNFDCTSYKSSRKNHQHVVICHSKKFNFKRDSNDDNYAIESVQLSNPDFRPAVHGILTTKEGDSILRVVGVHLKAQPKSYKKRLQQAEKISSYLQTEGTEISTVILGDFNTFVNQENDDVQSMSDIFAMNELVKVENKDDFTYRKGRRQSQLDHFWVSQELNTSLADAFDVCQDVPHDKYETFLDIKEYNKYISDHCPLTVELEIPNI